MKRILLLLVLVFGFGNVFGQSIFENPLTFGSAVQASPYTTGQIVNSNITVSGISRGSGITGTAAGNRYTASGWNSSSYDSNDYFEFTLTPNAGYKIDFVSFVYTGQASGTGPTAYSFRSSIDSYGSNIGTPTASGSTISLAATNFQGRTTATTFRIYGWGASASGGTFSINDFVFNGAVVSNVATPEINLQGNGNNIASGATTTSLTNNTDFGEQNINSGSTVKTFTIQNTGSVALNLTGSSPYVVISGANASDFAVTQIPSTPIAATSGTTTFQITFDPSIVGVKNATVSIANNDSDENPYTFAIQGTGITPAPKMVVKGNGITIVSGDTSPSVADGTNFGSTAINTTVTKTFTIENTGTADLILPASPLLLMNGTVGFSYTEPLSLTIAPNGSTTFTVSFNSATAGLKEDHVMIASNDNNVSSTYEFAISATATDFPANPSGTISGITPACTNTTLTYTGAIPSDETYYWQTSATGTSTASNAASTLLITTGGTYFVRAFRGGSWSVGASTGYNAVINATPAISVHPNTAVVGICPGATSTALSVTASGTSLSYQWYKSTDNSNATLGDDVTVGTNVASFTPSNSELGTFYYYVIVSGASPCSAVTSNVSGARTVNAKPATPQGTITPITSCGTATLAYNFAPGESTDGNTYYWQTNATNTLATLPVTSTYNLSSSGTIYVRSQNASGCWSDAVSQAIVISQLPIFTTNLTDRVVSQGATATFTIAGSNFSSRQWQESTDGGLTWNNVGTNANSFSLTNTTLSQNQNRYKVIVTNGSCVIESNVAILTVNNVSPNNATQLKACFATTEIDLRWTASTGVNVPTGYIVFALPNAGVPQMASADAGNASTYVANTNYSLATTYGTLGKAVYKGNATSATITGLTNASQYTFKVVAYIGETQTGWAAGILNSGTWNQTYTINIPEVTNVAVAPATTSSSISFNIIPDSSICNYEYVVVANQGAVTLVPSGDGSAYVANSAYAGGNQVIYKGNGIGSVPITGLTEGTSYCYKVFVRRGTEWSAGVEVCATAALTYCTSNGSNADATGITNVTFNTINQTSLSTGAYTNYTASASTTVILGESYPLSVRINTGGAFASETRAWIDWNRNGIFDANELYELGTATNVTNGLTSASPLSVTVPINAVVGNVWMRVSSKFNEVSTPCESFGYGEVEDYTINIQRPVGSEIALRGGTNSILSGSTTAIALNQTLFATQEIGTPSTAKEYTIFSIGTDVLTLSGTPEVEIIGANASEFVVTQQPVASIASGTSSTFQIVFTPTGPGTRTATVRIANNDTDENPFTFVIQGVGKSPEIDVQGNAILIASGSTIVSEANNTQFRTAQVTGGIVTKTFTILNTGSDVLTVSSVGISGLGSSHFRIASNPANTIAINGSTTFTVEFDPSSTGEKNAIVEIINNDLDEGNYTFAIQGYGVDYLECGISSEETILQQDFEDSPATPAWSYTVPTGSATITNDSAYGGITTSPVFLGGKSLQVKNSTATLLLNSVNTSELNDVNFSFRLGAYSVNSGNGLDLGDNVIVEVSVDGATWSREVQINGNGDAKWSFTSGTAIANATYTGLPNNPLTFGPTAGGNQTTEGYSTVNLTNLPKAENLRIRLVISNNNTNEIWAIDNVVLKGKRRAAKTWNGTDWLNNIGEISTAPTATEIAIINGDYSTTAGNLLGCKCQVNNGYTLTVIGETHMLIESEIINNGTIAIKDDGSLVQKNDFAVNTGAIDYERIAEPMYRYDYTYWSSPVTPQTLGDLSPATLADKYFKWDTNFQDWTNVLRTDEMEKGLGYIIRAPQTFSTNPLNTDEFTGNFAGIPNNGIVKVSVEGSNSAQKWNLLGNPYPSAISADKFLDSQENPDLYGTIYVWTHNTPLDPTPDPVTGFYSYAPSDYAVYNGVGGTSTDPSATVYEGYIAAGQGFFVRGSDNGTATFNNQMRVTNQNLQFLRTPASSRNASEKSRIWLNITNSQSAFKQTLIGYVNGATNEIDRKFDGEILGSNSLLLYSVIADKTLAIQGRALPFNTEDKVDLGYKTIAAGNLKISLSNIDGLFTDQNIYLEDKMLNVIHDLKQSDYSFSSAIGTFDNRFVLRYTNETLSNPDFNFVNNVNVYVKDKTVTIKSSEENIQKIAIYDLLGRVIYDSKNDVNSKEFSIHELSANNQALIVKIYFENGTETSKKIIVN